MFDDVIGLSRDEAAQWTVLVEQCRPILANDTMQAVQAFLVESGTSTIHAIAITWALLRKPDTPLRAAVDAVTESDARTQNQARPSQHDERR